MTTENFSFPSRELVNKWVNKAQNSRPYLQRSKLEMVCRDVATLAAGWGWGQRDSAVQAELQQARDEELEACCEWLSVPCPSYGRELRAARRPKSLRSRALDILEKHGNLSPAEHDAIATALENL